MEDVSASGGVDELIGRAVELASLEDVLRTRGAAVVSGDAGVGKTRLISALTGRAREAGFRVLLGHCLPFGGGALPYLPISEAFGRLAREDPDAVAPLRAQLPEIERLLPQRRLIGAVADETDRIGSAELFQAVLSALLILAESRPAVLVVEDVHWADTSTLDLLGFLLARTLGDDVAVVVTYRSDDLHRRHPLRPVVNEWGRLPGVVRSSVPPLSDDSMRSLVQQRHAEPMTERAIERVLRRAGGNAFFAEQLLVSFDDGESVPAELADLLLARVERLSGPARLVVRITAVAGRTVSHPSLRELTGLEDTELDQALREAVDAHVLARSSANSFGFRHALLAEAVYDDLLPGERVRLHRQFADALGRTTVVGTDADLARHARAALDLPLAFEAGVRAGQEAMYIGAPAEALSHYEVALELAARVAASDEQLVQVSLGAADAAAAAGHQFRAVHLLQDVLPSLPGDGDGDKLLRAEVLVAMSRHALPLDVAEDYFEISGEALRLVAADPSTALRGRALAVHARFAHSRGRIDDAIRHAGEARAIALELQLPDLAADAATTLAGLEQRTADPQRAVALLEASVAEAAASGDVSTSLRSLHSLGTLHYDLGELAPARSAFERVVQRGREAGQPWSSYPADALRMTVQIDYVTGHWDDALLTADSPTAPPLALALLRSAAMAVRAGRGEPDLEAVLEELRAWWSTDGMVVLLSGASGFEALGQDGRLDDALDLHDEMVAVIGELWQNPWFQARIRLHSLALGMLADAAGSASLSRRDALLHRGEALRADIDEVREKGLLPRMTHGPEGRAWLRRGTAEWRRLQWRCGRSLDPQELVEAWQNTVEAFTYGGSGQGHVFEHARSQARLAAARQATGDQSGAQLDADAARSTARSLGAVPLLSELRALSLHRPAAHPNTGPARLTSREQQVLMLVSAGRSNREIARTLFISDKTVSVHVSNILAKLGAAGRTEASAIARRDGLLT